MAMMDRKYSSSYWKRRSQLEKRLILFILLLSVILIIVVLCAISSGREESCTSVDCVVAATHILDYVDLSVKPCEDFHQFVCGSYMRKAEEHNKLSATKTLENKIKSQIDFLIFADALNTTTYSLKLQRHFYKSCINTTALEDEDNDTFLTLLDAVGGWPVTKSKYWDENIFDWKLTMIKSRKLGLSFQKLIGMDVIYIDSNETIIEITPPDDVDYIFNEIREPYVEVMRDIAIFLHSPSIGIASELRHVVDFNNELHRIVSKARNASNQSKTMQIHKLQEKFTRTSWVQFLNNILSGAAVVKETDLISVRGLNYLIDLEVLLLKTGKRVQGNYILWKVVEKFIPFLTENIRNRYEKFQRRYLDKKNIRLTRKETCIDLSKQLFTDVAETEYVRLHTDPETKDNIKQIFNRVKEKLLEKLKSSTRLSVELKDEIEEEMMDTEIFVGASDVVFDTEKMERILGYNDVAFYDDDLVKMVTKISINRVNHLFATIGKDHEQMEDTFAHIPHASVNAYYSDYSNLLMLPVSLLQDIFYNKNRPNYMNYGALVTTIGHEFAHSLGKLGNKTYEDRGKFVLVYNQAFFEAFGDSSKCFEEQYRQFYNASTENLKTLANVNETLEENIADFVGTDIGYELYQEYVDEHDVEPKLSGIDYTPNQVFWIMTGTFLCRKPSTGKEKHVHADSVYRINYRLRNLPQFSRDFHCPAGSFMNPEEKCKLF